MGGSARCKSLVCSSCQLVVSLDIQKTIYWDQQYHCVLEGKPAEKSEGKYIGAVVDCGLGVEQDFGSRIRTQLLVFLWILQILDFEQEYSELRNPAWKSVILWAGMEVEQNFSGRKLTQLLVFS